MTQNEILYGLPHWERLETDLHSVMDRILGEQVRKAGEPFDTMADRLEWPVKIAEYKRMPLPSPERIASHVLDEVLEWLDQDYTNWDDTPTEPTESLKQAAIAFANVVQSEYVAYACTPNGKLIEVTREEAKKMGDWRDVGIG